MLKTTLQKSQVGLKLGRIDWKDPCNIICVHLAEYGFHGQTIAEHTGLTRAQVYNRLFKAGKKLRSYRDGETQPARIIIKQYSVKSIQPKTVNRLMQQTVTPINF